MIFERDSPDKAGPGRPMPILSPTQRIDAEHVNLALILNLIRSNEATTRQEIEHQSGLGRAIVTDRLATLTELGLIDEGELGPTTGGRAPRNFRFCDDAGIILLAVIGQSTIGVGVSDLSGRLHVEHHESADTNNGPAAIVKRLFTLFDWVLEQRHNSREVWGIGIAVSAPVEDSFGQPFTTPVLHFMPGWDDYPLIEHLAVRYGAPVWIRNSVHMMTLGEQRAGGGAGVQNMIFVDINREIAAGLVSGGRLHTGAQGGAGMIGHISAGEDNVAKCRCGNSGCLETVAGADAIVREALRAAQDGRSSILAESLAAGGEFTIAEVGAAAQLGDAFSAELMSNCGRLIGNALATLTNAFNPSLIVLGGAMTQTSDIMLAAIREAIYRKSHPLATRELIIARSKIGSSAALFGAAMAVVDELLSTAPLSFWVTHGSPLRHPETTRLLAEAKEAIAKREPRPRPPDVSGPQRKQA